MKIWLISLITAFSLSAATVTAAATAAASGFAVESERAVPAPAPQDKEHVEILWNTGEASAAGYPVAYEERVEEDKEREYVLFPVRNTVRKLDAQSGELAGAVSLDDKVSDGIKGAVSGEVMVQPAGSVLYAINAVDMSVITSREFGEIATDCAVIGDSCYFGYKTAEGFRFVRADISNNLQTIWEYSSAKAVTSPALYGESVVFGAGDKLVVRTEEGEFAENEIPAAITNVFAGRYAVFMTCEDGTAKKVRLEMDGTVEKDSLMSCKLGENLTAMAGLNNRLYIGGRDGFFILDGLNMEILKSYPELRDSSAPLVTYGNGQRVFTVSWSEAENRDVLYGILDTEEGQTLSEIIKITDFEGGYFTALDSGVMLFRNADGSLWAISQSEVNIVVAVVKVILTLAILVMFYIIIRAWAKRHTDKSRLFKGK